MSVIQRLRNGIREESFTAKIEWQGKAIWRALGTRRRDEAERLERAIKKELHAGRLPDLLDQLRARADRTTANILTAYTAAGCPDAAMNPRTGRALERETAAINWLAKWFGDKNPEKINKGHSLQYLAWRRTTLTRKNNPFFTGKRTAELELQALANCFTWAHATDLIPARPPLQLRFRSAKEIRHAREVMPASADEIHTTAAWFFAPRLYPSAVGPLPSPGDGSAGRAATGLRGLDTRKHVFGWLKLFLPLTGLRIGEARLLLARPKLHPGRPDPGYTDDTHLHITREKRGCNPRIRLDDPARPWIRPLLDTIRAWHAVHHPASPWLFPGRAGAQLDKDAYRKALTEAAATLGLEHRTPHGDRAYYCSARLAQGIDIEDIARELGQRSGEDLVRDVYGLDLDDFQADTFKSLAAKFTWLPSPDRAPAWTWWTTQPTNIIQLAAS